ncbi:right-handed parallel beta-helix repeat-containing protein [Psychromonas sp.]|uniref:right-handed parallel beta-helix repeat-containing protein n=1 Tax=Psychromonas sp. TaxID=1884585 RepID=UPI003A98785E
MNSSLQHRIYLFFALITLSFSNAFAYIMPIGIPDTDIDFTQDVPERPNDWSEEIPGYYYIDTESGSNSMTYGSETAPRKSLPPSPVKAGSYIEIAGNLKLSGSYVLRVNGTNEAWVANQSGPVWITQSAISDGMITGGRLTLAGENVFVTDLNFLEGGKPQVGSPTAGYDIKNIVIRNNNISGSNLAGSGLSINRADNAIIYNNTIHNFGDVNATFDEDAHIISIGANNTNVWVLSNIQHTASGAGLQVLGDSSTTENIFIGDNEVYNVRQSGIWLKGGKNVVFSSNYVHDIIHTSWSVSKGMGAQYAPDELWMINNRIEGAEYGIRIASTSSTEHEQNIYIIGNVIHDISEKSAVGNVGGANSWQTAAIHLVGGSEIWIYNNLIFDAPNGITSSSQVTPTHVKNNIIFDLTNSQEDGNYGRSVWAEFLSIEDGGIELTNNYFDENMLIQRAGKSYTSISEIESLGATNNISKTPFASNTELEDIISKKSIVSYDFSEITDSGTDITNITKTLFTATFPTVSEGLNLDILSQLREQGNSIDIGPFETNGSKEIDLETLPESPVIININQVLNNSY